MPIQNNKPLPGTKSRLKTEIFIGKKSILPYDIINYNVPIRFPGRLFVIRLSADHKKIRSFLPKPN